MKRICASGWFVRIGNIECTPNTNNFVEEGFLKRFLKEHLRLKSLKYLRHLALVKELDDFVKKKECIRIEKVNSRQQHHVISINVSMT